MSQKFLTHKIKTTLCTPPEIINKPIQGVTRNKSYRLYELIKNKRICDVIHVLDKQNEKRVSIFFFFLCIYWYFPTRSDLWYVTIILKQVNVNYIIMIIIRKPCLHFNRLESYLFFFFMLSRLNLCVLIILCNKQKKIGEKKK